MTPEQQALQLILSQKYNPHFLPDPLPEIPIEQGTSQKAVERKIFVTDAIAAPIVSSDVSKIYQFFPELQKTVVPVVEIKKTDSTPQSLTSKQWNNLIRWNT